MEKITKEIKVDGKQAKLAAISILGMLLTWIVIAVLVIVNTCAAVRITIQQQKILLLQQQIIKNTNTISGVGEKISRKEKVKKLPFNNIQKINSAEVNR